MRFSLSASCLFLLFALLPGVMAQPDNPARAEPAGRYQGQLLVSTERNLDPRFHRSVIYMVRHTSQSAFGLVVNKPYGKGTLANMMKGLGLDPEGASGELNLHYGGPVAVNNLFFLHSSDYVHEKSKNVDGTVSFTKDIGILKAVAARTGPKRLLVAVGYAGWGGRQLEGEIARGMWKVAPSGADLVFGSGKKNAWDRLTETEEIPL